MKKSYILIALAMIAALSMTGCKNNRKNQNQEPTQEEIQAQKQALADSVLAKIDAVAEVNRKASDNTFNILEFNLTDKEKLVKPDYLLAPSVADTLITTNQKVNALGIYIMDRGMMKIYDMPTDEISTVIAKLFAEISTSDYEECFKIDGPYSEKIKSFYAKAKECNELPLFWQLQNATHMETSYLIVHNPDLFFSRITEDQWQSYRSYVRSVYEAVTTLAEYDDEIAAIMNIQPSILSPLLSLEDYKKANSTKESAKQFRIDNKDTYVARRNALLQ